LIADGEQGINSPLLKKAIQAYCPLTENAPQEHFLHARTHLSKGAHYLIKVYTEMNIKAVPPTKPLIIVKNIVLMKAN
jgi:hypothetical protein